MNRTRFLVYKSGLSGPREINSHLLRSIKRCVWDDTAFVPRAGDTIINWGSTKWPLTWPVADEVTMRFPFRLLNNPYYVFCSQDKRQALQTLKAGGVNVPEFTTDHAEAVRWFNEGYTVVRRGTANGHSGAGITLHNAKDGDSSPTPAPLYTKYRPKRHEYRVHVFGGKVIDVQQKRKRSDVPAEAVDFQVRSYANGWVFCRENVNLSHGAMESALLAVGTLHLDFGAVDIGLTEKGNVLTVYEVNTAPGLEGTTAVKYAEAINEYLSRR